MNKIYKVQYNDALGTWVAVPEIAKGRSKSTSSAEHTESTASLSKPGKWALTTLAAALLPMISGQAFADDDVKDPYKYTAGEDANINACFASSASNRMTCGVKNIVAGYQNISPELKQGDKANAISGGFNTYVGASNTIAFGNAVEVGGKEEVKNKEDAMSGIIAFGDHVKVNAGTGNDTIAIGTNAEIKQNQDNNGSPIKDDKGNPFRADRAIAIGNAAKAQYADSLVLGANSTDTYDNRYAEDETDEDGTKKHKAGEIAKATAATITAQKTTVDKDNKPQEKLLGESKIKYDTNYSARTPNSVASFGQKDQERRLINVASGNVKKGSTDAINGSQLYATNSVLDNLAYSVANNLGGDATVQKDGSVTGAKYEIVNLSYNPDNNNPNNPNSVENFSETTVHGAIGKINEALKKKITFLATEGEKDKDGKLKYTEQKVGLGEKLKIVGAENSGITTKAGNNGITIDVDNQTVVDGAQLPVVYTTLLKDKDGKPFSKRVYRVKEKPNEKNSSYKFAYKDDKGKLRDDKGNIINLVDPSEVIASMNNADGDVNSAMKLNNIAKGTQASDAGNVAQLNDILKKLGTYATDGKAINKPFINEDGEVVGLEYHLTSGNPNEDWHKALGKAEYDKEYTARYDALKAANDAKPQDQQQTDDALKAQAREAAEALAIDKRKDNYNKVTSVGDAIRNLNTAVNQAITVKADKGVGKYPDSQGVYLGGGFSILGGDTEIKTKNSSGNEVTNSFNNITTTINKDGEVKVALKEEITIDKATINNATMNNATVNNVKESDGKSVVNIDYLNEHATDQMPVVYTSKDKDGNTIQVKKKGDKYVDNEGKAVDPNKINASMKTIDGKVQVSSSGEKVATDAPTFETQSDGNKVIKGILTPTGDEITVDLNKRIDFSETDSDGAGGKKAKGTLVLDNIAGVGDFTNVANATKAVNGADLNNAIAGVLNYVGQNKGTNGGGWNLAGTDGQKTPVATDETVQLQGADSNISVVVNNEVPLQNAKGEYLDEQGKVLGPNEQDKAAKVVQTKIKLNPELTEMKKIEFVQGDDGKSSSVSISKNGIKAGEKKITNVADGAINASSHDAVNGSQLYRLKQDIDNIDNRASAGTAAAMATAGLSQVYLPGKSMVSAAASHYRGQSAIAVGLSSISDNGKWIIKGAANANKEDLGVTVGVGYMW